MPALAQAKRNVYVSNTGPPGNVSAFDVSAAGSLSLLGSSPFVAGDSPHGVAVSPDGKHLYAANTSTNNVSAYDVSADGSLAEVTGSPFAAGTAPQGVAVSPDGKHLYVASSNGVSAYDIAADGTLTEVAGSPFTIATGNLVGVAVAPDGKHLFAASRGGTITPGNITVFDIAADGTLTNISGLDNSSVGFHPAGLATSPDGNHLYAADRDNNDVFAYDIAADGTLAEVTGSPFPAGDFPESLATSPDGKHLYVVNRGSNNVSIYDIAADGVLTEVTGSPFLTGNQPTGVAASPDSSHLYVANYVSPPSTNVSAYDIAADGTLSSITGSPFASGGVGPDFQSVAITPNQPPVASFTVGAAEAGSPASFDASASTDLDGTVATYDWDFGDGNILPDGGPTPTHTYASAADYDVIVALIDNEGCSTRIVYTGQTASCNGSAVAEQTRSVSVANPPSAPAPKTKIKGKPKYAQSKDTRFRFTSSIEGSKFKCKLDKSKYKGCSSPKNYKNLKKGKHTFYVYAISPDGVRDQSPAKVKFKVKGKGKKKG